MIITFTGHRPSNRNMGGYDWNSYKNKAIMKELKQIILNTINNINEIEYYFVFGGAIGFDQMAFHVVNEIKKESMLNIYTEIAVPFKNQDIRWSNEDRIRYKKQLKEADYVVYVDVLDKYQYKSIPVGQYHPAKMQLRNMYMVDKADLIIACWDGSSGGTANCVKYATSKKKDVFFTNPAKIYI